MVMNIILNLSGGCGHFFRSWKIDSQIWNEFIYFQFFLNFRYDSFRFNKPICLGWADSKGIKELINVVFRIEDKSAVVFIIIFHKDKQCTCIIWAKKRKSSSKICDAIFIARPFTIVEKSCGRLIIILPSNVDPSVFTGPSFTWFVKHDRNSRLWDINTWLMATC